MIRPDDRRDRVSGDASGTTDSRIGALYPNARAWAASPPTVSKRREHGGERQPPKCAPTGAGASKSLSIRRPHWLGELSSLLLDTPTKHTYHDNNMSANPTHPKCAEQW